MEKYLKAELIKHKAIDNSINMNLKLCLKYIKENVLIAESCLESIRSYEKTWRNAYIEVPVCKGLLDETVEEPFIVER